MLNFKWLKCAFVRAVKTFAQTFAGSIGAGAVVLGDVNFGYVLSASTLAFILSIITSLAYGLPEVTNDNGNK